jgi:hypothetical protein
MDRSTHAHAHGRRRRFAALTGFAILTASLGAGALSLALFTDTAGVGQNDFSTGSVDISTTPATALFTVSTMMPGDTENRQLTVTNSGTARLRYAMSTTVDNGPALAGQLELTVKTLGTSCAAYDGTTLVGPTALGGAGFGDVSPGPQGGERELAAAASEELCFRVHLPDTTGNAFEDASTTVTFTFDAEQTKNNP